MATKRALSVAVMALLVGALAIGARAGQSNPKMGPRDQVTITVFNAPDMSGKFTLDAEGVFVHPLIGPVRAGGLTARELEEAVRDRLRDGDYHRNARVTVELQQALNKAVTVTGEVRVQGPVAFAGEITLFAALVKAGMTTSDAGEEILIVRPARDRATNPAAEDEVLTVNLRDLTGGNLTRHDIPLRDGDIVMVLKVEQVIITGYVNRPGAYTITAGMTVRAALALAGDIAEKGTSRGLRILRRVPGRAAAQEFKNVKLTDVVKPGDTIIVGKSIL